ncbi:MAG: diguanylate cyclase [Actinobacteria bacterium]|nr:diguanylate cyclase [Actinomycetota bacterium]
MDGLTGLANRRQADESLATELARAERLGGPVGLILADVDENARLHQIVERQALVDGLTGLANRRQADDTAARWGGEEFAVILPGTDLDGSAQVAERVRVALAERMIVSADGVPLSVTASFGVAATTAPSTQEQLIHAADGALYRASAPARTALRRH